MKIALITIHWANSYGGMLQAYASQHILSKYGDVSIIDYKTEHLDKTMCLFRYGFGLRDFLRMAKDLTRIVPRYQLLKKFKLFIFSNFNLTKPCQNLEDLKSLEKEFDFFVCGSDQIWNPNIIQSFDTNYFLSFVTNKKKISYASSSGSYEFSNKEKSQLKECLNDFYKISTREANTANYLNQLLSNNDVTDVIDPTLMLTKEEWLDTLDISITNTSPYVLVYTLRKDQFVRDTVTYISKKLSLKVIVIDQDPYLGYKADNHIQNAAPKDYIKLFANASFVITNSFHGTAFSVNFEVPFFTIKPESGVNRVENFLKNVGLEKQLILDDSNIENINTSINFSESSKKLELLRIKSFNFLDACFNDEN